MSDHVANLVGRTLGTAQVVQPRIASRFAGTGGAISGFREIASEVEPSRADAPLPVASLQTDSGRTTVQTDAAIPRNMPVRAAEEVRVTDVRHPIEHMEPRIVRQAAPPMGADAAPAVEAVEETLAAPAYDAAPRLVVNTPQTKARELAPLTRSRQTEASSEARRPVVRVHIGSIEVRAVQTAEPKRATAPSPTATPVSLDSYLRGRKGASR
jgi:hypothetical protein